MTGYHPDRHYRRSIRLRGYDYSTAGAYFVTVCAAGRACLFGEVSGNDVQLNQGGMVVKETWDGLPSHYPHVVVDAFVVMPNHIHGIIVLTDDVGAGLKPALTPALTPAPTGVKRHGLPEIVRAFKTFSARQINEIRKHAAPVWQRNYYEHIIRNGDALDRIRGYIAANPANWAQDMDNPARTPVSGAAIWRTCPRFIP